VNDPIKDIEDFLRLVANKAQAPPDCFMDLVTGEIVNQHNFRDWYKRTRMHVGIIVCDGCGAEFRGPRRKFKKGWRKHNGRDLCPLCPTLSKQSKTQRNAALIADRKAGMSFRELAEKYDMTTRRTQQIVAENAKQVSNNNNKRGGSNGRRPR
jgi:hypothetical protein